VPADRSGSGVPLRWNALPNALDPGFHCARTHWIRDFITFRLAQRTPIVVLMMPAVRDKKARDRFARVV
jgi:hypothetical protein